VEVFHFGETPEGCFYAMELVEGESLHERVRKKGPLAPPALLSVAEQIAGALAAAESLRLVHRDIKPSNIMLTEMSGGELRVKLIDFGLAKQAACADQSTSGPVTVSGFVGTPMFASPEQLEERALDTRSDIYSLGVTLWYALTGRFPFEGTTATVISRHLTESPPAQDIAPYPRPLQDLLLAMLEKDPADRPQTALALREEIVRCRKAVAAESQGSTLGTTRVEDAVAKALSLRHPNLVKVIRVEGHGAKRVIETEPLNGFSLLDWLRARRRLPLREVMPLLEQLAALIDFAIDRDLRTMDLRIARVWIHFPAPSDEDDPAALIRWPADKWPAFAVKARALVHMQKTEAPGTCFATIVPDAGPADPEQEEPEAGQDYLFQLARMVYELVAGHPPAAGPGAEYRVIAALDEVGNRTLREILERKSPITTAYGLVAALRGSGRESRAAAPAPQEPAGGEAGPGLPPEDPGWTPSKAEIALIVLSGLALFGGVLLAGFLLLSGG
jgi:serine/threonine protein kinase